MINPDRLKECNAILAMALNTDDDATYEFEGEKIKLSDYIPVLFKHLTKVILKNEEKSEEILQFIVEAIHYCREFTDEPPEVVMMSKEDYEKMQHGMHPDPKVKI